MSGVLCDKRVPPHVKGKSHNIMIVQPAMVYGMETVPVTSSHMKKLEVTEMKMCRWPSGHTLTDYVRNENIKERLKVEIITERYMKARLRWFGHVKRRDQDYVGRTTLEIVYHPGEESEEDRSRDGWTVSTETWEPSERRQTRSMTELAGGELCLPLRPHNQVRAARSKHIWGYRDSMDCRSGAPICEQGGTINEVAVCRFRHDMVMNGTIPEQSILVRDRLPASLHLWRARRFLWCHNYQLAESGVVCTCLSISGLHYCAFDDIVVPFLPRDNEEWSGKGMMILLAARWLPRFVVMSA